MRLGVNLVAWEMCRCAVLGRTMQLSCQADAAFLSVKLDHLRGSERYHPSNSLDRAIVPHLAIIANTPIRRVPKRESMAERLTSFCCAAGLYHRRKVRASPIGTGRLGGGHLRNGGVNSMDIYAATLARFARLLRTGYRPPRDGNSIFSPFISSKAFF